MDYYVAVTDMSKMFDICLAINIIFLGGLALLINIFVSDENRKGRKMRQEKGLLKTWLVAVIFRAIRKQARHAGDTLLRYS